MLHSNRKLYLPSLLTFPIVHIQFKHETITNFIKSSYHLEAHTKLSKDKMIWCLRFASKNGEGTTEYEIGQMLIILEANWRIHGDLLHSSFYFCVCLKFSIIKKFLKIKLIHTELAKRMFIVSDTGKLNNLNIYTGTWLN